MKLFFALLLVSSTVMAQAAPKLLRLTLNDSVRLALKQNIQVLQARLRTLEGDETVRISRSALLPQANLNVTQTVQRLNENTIIGAELPNPTSIGPYQTVSGGASAIVPLINLANWRNYAASKKSRLATGEDEKSAREAIIATVVANYLSLLRSVATERAAQSRLDLARALLQQANAKLREGTGTSVDASRAEVQVQAEDQAVINAQLETRSIRLGLAEILDLDDDMIIEPTDALLSPAGTVPDEASLLQSAFLSRPELRASEFRAQAARDTSRAEEALRYPVLSFNESYSENGRSPARSIPVYIHQVELTVPIVTGGRLRAQAQRAKLEQQSLERDIRDQRNKVRQEVRTAIARIQASQMELASADRAVQLSNLEVKQARDRFGAGVTDNIEVITAQNQLAQATDSQISALYRYNQGQADLAKAIGELETRYTR